MRARAHLLQGVLTNVLIDCGLVRRIVETRVQTRGVCLGDHQPPPPPPTSVERFGARTSL